MSASLRILFRKPEESRVLLQLRERLLQIMLLSSFMVGTVLFGVALIPVLQKRLYISILGYSLLYILTILITFMKKLPFNVRAVVWLGILYIFGSTNLFMSGFNVDAGLFLITFIAMAILLMDLPAGLVAMVMCFVSLSIFGFINVTGNYRLPMDLPQTNPLLWIIGGIIFLLMGMLLVYSLAVVINGLEENLAKTTRLAEELEKTNHTLRMSEARYRTLLETSPGLVALVDLNGNIVMSSKVGLALFGYENLQEVAGKNLMGFIEPQDHARVAEAFQKTLDGRSPNNLECIAIRKDGTQFLAEFNGTLVLDEAGEPQAVICIGRDITASKEAEKNLRDAKDALAEKVVETTVQLKQTADRLEELVKHVPTVIYSYRASEVHSITYISENSVELTGYKPSEIIEEINYWDRVHPEDKARIFAVSEQLRESERVAFDYRFLHKDGTYRWLHDERVLRRDSNGTPLEYIGSWSDISKRKGTEENLKISEAKYRNLYENMMDAYVSVNMEGRLVEFNQAYEKMLGYQPDELRRLSYIDLTPKKWHDFEAGIVEKQVLPNGYSEIYEKEYIRKNGSVFPVELRTVLIRDEEGNSAGMWAIVRDISERKLIEETLRDSEGRYRDLLDNSMQGIIVFMDMRIFYVNQVITESLGYNPAELQAFTPADIISRVHPDDRQMFQERLRMRLDGTPTSERYTLRVIHKNGEIRWVEARTVTIDLQGKTALMTTAIDVTEIKQAEAEILENARILQTILNSSDALVFLLDTKGILLASNDKFVQRMGKNGETLIGTSVYDLLPEDLARTRKAWFDQVVSTGKPVTFIDERKGIWFKNSLFPIMDESGNVTSVANYARDITEQRRVEAQLVENEKIQRTILNATDALVFLVNSNDVIISANEKFMKHMGLNADTLGELHFSNIQPEEVGRARKKFYEQVVSSGKPVTFIDSRAGNWFENSFYPILDGAGKVISVAVYSRDITEQRRVTEALRASEEQYRKLAEAAHDMIFIIDWDDRIQYVNSFGAKFLGMETKDVVGQPRVRFFPTEANSQQIKNIQTVLDTGEALAAESSTIINNRKIWLNTWLVPLRDDAGNITSVLGVSRDTTARKNSEEALEQARNLLEVRVAERTKELISSQEKLRNLTAQTIAAQEEERRVISRELHDEAGQALITLKYGLAAIESELPASDTLPRKRLSDSMKIIDQTMVHIRALAHRLRPPVLEIGGIDLSLQEYCREISGRTNIPIYYQGMDIPGLPDEMGISLFRFVQEALTNTLKHANATEVKVKLLLRKGEISLSVSDNGRGIDEFGQKEGLGLQGIKERLNLLGGQAGGPIKKRARCKTRRTYPLDGD